MGGVLLSTTSHTLTMESTEWLKDQSFLQKWCELFNAIFPTLRQPIVADKEPDFPEFKEVLDKWLTKVPDPPGSNSILQQITYSSQGWDSNKTELLRLPPKLSIINALS